MKNYSRVVNLQCPICGSVDFIIENESNDVIQATCKLCNRTLSKDEVMQNNSENINTHINEVKEEIIDDITNTFKSIFK